MSIKKQYHIDDATLDKLKRSYILILLGSPFVASVFSFLTWPIIDGFSWTLVPLLPWSLCYVFFLFSYKSYFIHSRRTLLILTINIALFVFYFGTMASACSYRIYSMYGLIITISLLVIIAIIIFTRSYPYWNTVWQSHINCNKLEILDLNNARYDFLNNFNMTENKKKEGKSLSLIPILSSIIPVASGLGIILSKKDHITWILVLGMILCSFATLGFIKTLTGSFYNYRKLIYFEKKIKGSIINGLLK